jgi:hypothetical protein
MLNLVNRASRATEEDERVISVLQDQAGSARDKRMVERGGEVRVVEEPA